MANMIGGVPRFSGQSPTPAYGLTFSRTHFLDGTLQTYFGPGQQIGFNYTPPGDWPAAGTLLHVPQVVQLVLSGNTSQSGEALDPSNPSSFAQVGSDQTAALLAVVLQAFQDAQAIISNFRSNRTWVTIGSLGDFPANTQLPAVPVPMVTTPWFGTQFLQIWVGYMLQDDQAYSPSEAIQAALTGETITRDPINGFGTITNPFTVIPPDFSIIPTDIQNLANAVSWQNSLVWVPISAPLFSLYGVHFYVADSVTSEPDEVTSLQAIGAADDAAINSIVEFVVSPTYPDGLDVYYAGSGGDTAAQVAQTIAISLTGEYIQYTASDMYAQALAGSFGPYVVYQGGASQITAQSLVAEIAAFFNFDPSTGVDLPPPAP